MEYRLSHRLRAAFQQAVARGRAVLDGQWDVSAVSRELAGNHVLWRTRDLLLDGVPDHRAREMFVVRGGEHLDAAFGLIDGGAVGGRQGDHFEGAVELCVFPMGRGSVGKLNVGKDGRFDEIFFVDLPTRDERIEVFRIHLNKRGRDAGGFELNALGESSKDFSGAEIEEAINSALYDAFYASQDITTEHVLTALSQTVPLAKTMDEQISALRSWAEGRARNASLARPHKP